MTQKIYNPSVLRTLSLMTLALVVLEFLAKVLEITQPISAQFMPVGFTQEILGSRPIIFGMLYFLLGHVLINAVLVLILWLITSGTSKFFRFDAYGQVRFAIALWIVAQFAIFLANQILFPWSSFALLPYSTFLILIYKWVLLVLMLSISIAILLAFVPLIQWTLRSDSWLFILPAFILSFIIGGTFYYKTLAVNQSNLVASNQPNIVIFSIDALRPDYMGFLGNHAKTPHLDSILAGSTIFINNFTTLARTEPAWISILTGEYPKTNGVRYNLPDIRKIDFSKTLPTILSHYGYATIFASDGRQFNNIGEPQGFKYVISIPMGFNNFILSALNDFPLSNLLVNTLIGKWLFPYSYASRDAAITYQPQTYVKYFARSLAEIPQRPVFLCIHLGLPHWPLIWANAPKARIRSFDDLFRIRYKNAVERVDQQFAAMMEVLKKNHLLNNTLFILISDHGEGLGYPNELITQKAGYIPGDQPLPESVVTSLTQGSFGHGTDILNLKQYHSLLAFRSFNLDMQNHPRQIALPVAIVDINPTLLKLLNIREKSQGISLLPYIFGDRTTEKARDIFIESGFNTPSLKTSNPDLKMIIRKGLGYYKINPDDGLIHIRPEVAKYISQQRQRAIIAYPWFFAKYPLDEQETITILANIQTRQWTTDLHSNFAKNSPLSTLQQAFEKFYENDY